MADGSHQEKRISLFYSYSHRDEELRKKLEDHLAVLRWSEKIAEWHDRNIDVGDEWAKEIDRNLSSADIILLLVSSSFIASPYCWSVEMTKALERHDKGEAKVIPVILRPCAWHATPFAKLQAAPTDARPVTSWSDPDDALYDVARKIERTVTDLQQQRRRAGEKAQEQAQEARKRAEAKAGVAVEEQKRNAQQRREQGEAEGAQVPKLARKYDARGRQQLKWMTTVGLIVLVGFAGVVAWQQWPTQEQLAPTEKESPPTPSPPPVVGDTTKPSVAPPPTEPAVKPDQPEVTTRPSATSNKDQPGQTYEQPPAEETARRDVEKDEKAVVPSPAPAPAPNKRTLEPLDTLKDCAECPEMVVLAAGSFMRGSPANEPERSLDEGPQRRVTIGPFAIGKTEVTFAQWDACVTAGGCNGYKPPDQGWGRGSWPVVNVSWKDAKAYVSWLSQHTGKPYRLPSEAEWEYAARAGTTTRYAFGDAITPKNANYSESKLGKTTEVGTYPPNSWGLYDMHGNVWEWVEDIYHGSYRGAPNDGSAWTGGEGKSSSLIRVLRGGSWGDKPGLLRSAVRGRVEPDDRYLYLGLRVARTLD